MANTVVMENKALQPKLLIVSDGHISQSAVKKHMVLGRTTDSQIVDIDLPHNFVSRRHGEFGYDALGYFYIDTLSKNGTFYNGAKLQPERKQYMKNGDVLHIFNGYDGERKDFVVMVYLTDYPDIFEEKTIELNSSVAEVSIGRGNNTNDTNIVMNDNTISRNHASFFLAQSGWAVIDHNSKNGVYLNNRRIERPKYINIGDCIRISNIHFFFLGRFLLYQSVGDRQIGSGRGQKSGVSNTALNIHIVERSVWQHAKKLMLLQNINITVNAGEMVLILGGSGAGKTTFMNAVMGYERAKGRIMHGNTDIYEDFESMKYKIGFVPQQDLLRGSDTVYHTLENAARMKLPGTVSKAHRMERIENVLETLGIKQEQKALVSKLSGGQRKRLSIAVEYIADPSLFFLDEPDSGVDGPMTESIMKSLRIIANEGKIVMVISHIPDRSAMFFDKVIVLAKSAKNNSGQLAFFGNVEETYKFFGVETLEGVVKRINRKDEGGDGLSDFFIDKYNRQMNRR